MAFFRSTLLDEAGESSLYWFEARRPLPTLLFVLPIIAAYEVGVSSSGVEGVSLRNGADCWMRMWMLGAGLPGGWLLPSALIACLLAWQVVGRHPWRVSFDTMTGMFGESLLFALLLVACGQSLAVCFRTHGFEAVALAADPAAPSTPVAARALSFLGAGVYEELLFRLTLIPVCFYLLRVLLIPRGISLVLAVLSSSVVFAAAHYLEPQSGFAWGSLTAACRRVADDPSLWYGFAFRLFAGLAFSVLLLLRGFGITVGSHALYDLVAGVVMQVPEVG